MHFCSIFRQRNMGLSTTCIECYRTDLEKFRNPEIYINGVVSSESWQDRCLDITAAQVPVKAIW